MSEKHEPLWIIAWGIAIGCGLAGLGLVLKFLLPALGAMVGIATAIITGGIVSTTVSSWVIPAAGIGLATTGGAAGIILLVKVVEEAKKKPFEWALPILAIVSGLVVDSCKELFQTDNDFIRIIYGASVSSLFLLGGILWTQKKVKFKWISTKIISIIVFLTPPFLIYLRYCQSVNKNLLEGFNDIPTHIFGSIGILIIILLLITFLSWIFKEED